MLIRQVVVLWLLLIQRRRSSLDTSRPPTHNACEHGEKAWHHQITSAKNWPKDRSKGPTSRENTALLTMSDLLGRSHSRNQGAGCSEEYACAKSLTHVRLCDSMVWSPPGSSVHGILQVRTLEWVTRPFSMGSSQPNPGLRLCRQILVVKRIPLSLET